MGVGDTYIPSTESERMHKQAQKAHDSDNNDRHVLLTTGMGIGQALRAAIN